MSAAVPLAFPGSRSLAGWWRQLAPVHPRALWVAHLVLHRVEAQVRLLQPRRPDQFHRLLLTALETAPALDRLQERLSLGWPVLRQALRELEAAGLTQGTAQGPWTLTELGRQAQQHGEYSVASLQRRPFYFLESGRPDRPPHFINLNAATAIPWPAGADWRFDARQLADCLHQPVEWKRRHGFPLEVEEILGINDLQQNSSATQPDRASAELESPPWQSVILDQPERLLAVLVQTRTDRGKDRLLGFAVQQKGWSLDATAPILAVVDGLRDLFPELAVDLSLERWGQAWKSWAQANNLTAAEIEVCTLKRQDHRLQVTVPRGVLDRLRAARSEAMKGEAWVLTGEDRIRTAALLELTTASGGRS